MRDLRCACVYYLNFDEQGNTEDAATGNDMNELKKDETDKFDQSSDQEVVEDGRKETMLLQGEIGSSATFLLGARIRFERVVPFNDRLLY